VLEGTNTADDLLDEPDLHNDYDTWLEQLALHEPTGLYQHNLNGEDNADAHLIRQVTGRELVVAITEGHLDFGPWEQIFYGKFDDRRRKRVLVQNYRRLINTFSG
jgi:thiamine phosphate synthase YjbQ (UPF0047 family)